MSRTLFLSMNESDVVSRCLAEEVGISAIERLPGGGVRLVCMSGDGAARLRTKLRSKLISADALRERHRPRTPLW